MFQELKGSLKFQERFIESSSPSAPSWGPDREVVQEGGCMSLFLSTLPLEGGVWVQSATVSPQKWFSGLSPQEFSLASFRVVVWEVRKASPSSSRWRVLCQVRIERLEAVCDAVKLGWKKCILFPCLWFYTRQEVGILGLGHPKQWCSSHLSLFLFLLQRQNTPNLILNCYW